MTGIARRTRSGFTRPLFRLSRGLRSYVLLVDIVVGVWSGGALVRSHLTWSTLGVLALMASLALVFEEGASHAARLHFRLNIDLKRDMISVWAIAAAVALPTAAGVLLLGVVLSYVWLRQKRPAGQPLHRTWFNGSTELLGFLCAAVVARTVEPALSGAASVDLASGLAVLSAMVVYAVVNRVLVTVAVIWSGGRGRALLGTKDDNLVEFATICLGGLVSLAVVYNPWLVLLALVPMISLQRGAMVRELETVATTDAKTGLLNAIALEHLGHREVARAERENAPLAVLIIDIDHFKLVNDRHGHLVGDEVLRGVGKVLTTGVREYDTVGRFGGEEFVAILPAADEAEALTIAERLRSQVATLRVGDIDARAHSELDDGLSVSIGVSCYGIDGLAMSDLLFAADAALYGAKAGGRNRVMLADRGVGGSDREGVVV